MSRPLIMSLGHRFRSDDGAGPRVLDTLRHTLREQADYQENPGDIAALISAWEDRECVYLIDAYNAPRQSAGTVLRLDGLSAELPVGLSRASSHALNLEEAIALSRQLGSLPGQLIIYAIGGHHFVSGEQLSAGVAAAVTRVAQAITEELTLSRQQPCMSNR